MYDRGSTRTRVRIALEQGKSYPPVRQKPASPAHRYPALKARVAACIPASRFYRTARLTLIPYTTLILSSPATTPFLLSSFISHDFVVQQRLR